MAGVGTLEQIEADLQFCEDVLNKKAHPCPGRGEALHGRSGGGTACRTAGAHGGTTHRATSAAAPARQQAHHPPLSQQPKQESPLQQQRQKTQLQPQQPAGPTARTTEELLHMLSSVPAGQPFEIDTRLLYSPQSSFNASRQSSPSAQSSRQGSGVDEQYMQQRRGGSSGGSGGGAHFSLPAYRQSTDGRQALFSDIAQAATALIPGHSGYVAAGRAGVDGRSAPSVQSGWEPEGDAWQAQQHAAGPPPSLQQQQLGSRSHGQGSPAGSHYAAQRPSSAPLRKAGSGGDGSMPGTSSRQLLLEQYMADGGVQGRAAELLRLGREDRIKQLAQPRTDLWHRCAQIRVQEEHAELRECTFAPQTGRPPSRQRLSPGVAVEDRLYLAQQGRQDALDRARSEKEREQLATCTFAPQLVTHPERHLRQEYTPLHRRLGEEQRRRSTKMAQARVQADLGNADLTFQPQLNQRSLKLAAEKEARDLDKEPHARSQQQQQQRRPSSAGPPCGGSSGGDGGFTFSPAINRASERLLEDSSTVPTDFQERLRYYSMRKELKQRAAVEADAGACTFRPDTGNAVQVLALSASRAGNLLESEQERYERMGGDEAQRLAGRRAAKEAEVYGSLDFKPQLNARSLAMAPGGSGGVKALASADKQRRRLAELRQVEEDRQRAECTFQPDTSKPRVKGYYDEYQPPRANAPISIAQAAKQGFERLTQQIADYQADQEARAAIVRAEEQAKQLQGCSFAPDVNRRRVQAKGPVVVRGLERYLELKQLAERQKQEADERAARVFNLNPRAKQGATVPQPFQLAGHALLEAKAAEKQAVLLEGRLCDRMRDCTFRPRTNHQRRQEQLDRILAQPSLTDSELAGAAYY